MARRHHQQAHHGESVRWRTRRPRSPKKQTARQAKATGGRRGPTGSTALNRQEVTGLLPAFATDGIDAGVGGAGGFELLCVATRSTITRAAEYP